MKKKTVRSREGIRYQIYLLRKNKRISRSGYSNLCRVSRVIFSRYTFYLSGNEEIFPVGNISARRIAARNCIICKVPLKMSLPTHISRNISQRQSAVRSFEDTPLLFATMSFTRLHGTTDTWHTHTYLNGHEYVTHMHMHMYTRIYADEHVEVLSQC